MEGKGKERSEEKEWVQVPEQGTVILDSEKKEEKEGAFAREL
jgi:hypothetical protein